MKQYITEEKEFDIKKLEQAWWRAEGDPDKEAKIIAKYNLINVFSKNRPGEIILGLKNELERSKKPIVFAGVDDANKLILITNNPIKIWYPQKNKRHPHGTPMKSLWEAKKQLVILATMCKDIQLIESYLENTELDLLEIMPSELKRDFNLYNKLT